MVFTHLLVVGTIFYGLHTPVFFTIVLIFLTLFVPVICIRQQPPPPLPAENESHPVSSHCGVCILSWVFLGKVCAGLGTLEKLWNFSSFLTITGKFLVMIQTHLYVSGSCEHHPKLTIEMHIPLRRIPKEDCLRR